MEIHSDRRTYERFSHLPQAGISHLDPSSKYRNDVRFFYITPSIHQLDPANQEQLKAILREEFGF